MVAEGFNPRIGCVPEKGESHYVPGTGEDVVRKRTNFSPVPGTFTPNRGRTHCRPIRPSICEPSLLIFREGVTNRFGHQAIPDPFPEDGLTKTPGLILICV